ncbi:MAG: tRNA 2-thiouridine(34) synthase MnmA [Armatimonadota bacterium]
MPEPDTVIVAMSGGVDSSVAAALLHQQGYRVIGVTMQIWPRTEAGGNAAPAGGCCSAQAAQDARAVARRLGVPHHVFNLREAFEQTVIADFVSEYARGRTPNPCIRCNELVKFGELRRRASALGAQYVATGHYARIECDGAGGRFRLRRGVDPEKDQSYALYSMTQAQLAGTLMPLGGLTKGEVRELARQLGLPVAAKADSQEICFVTDDDYRRLIAQRQPQALRPGPILDREGNVLGQHAGTAGFTIGQRRGLGIGGGRRLYVVDIDPERNALIVGPAEDLLAQGCLVEAVNWVATDAPQEPLRAEVALRYRSRPVPALLEPGQGVVEVAFERPAGAVAPGQAAVFYRGDEVLGGGTIRGRWAPRG